MSRQSSSVGDAPPSALSSDEASSPAPKPRAHESIWKRSKKILGMGRFEFLQQTSANTSSDKTVEGNGKDGVVGTAGVSKRREQVRRAQKTHRQRTEHYIKALEQEVLRLQKVEEEALKIQEQQKRQEDYIRALEQQVVTLSSQEMSSSLKDLDLAFESSDFGSEADYFAKITMSTPNEDGNSVIRAEMSPELIRAPVPTYVGNNPVAEEEFNKIVAYWGHLASINLAASCQQAINFVLYLEYGCSGHVHKVGSNPAHVSGHALTTSGRFIERAPEEDESPDSWTASCAAIMKLFALSASLPLNDHEITPIQAWQKIWQHPQAPLVREQDLEFLQIELRKIITCYGFGGVIDATDFSAVLETMFARIKSAPVN